MITQLLFIGLSRVGRVSSNMSTGVAFIGLCLSIGIISSINTCCLGTRERFTRSPTGNSFYPFEDISTLGLPHKFLTVLSSFATIYMTIMIIFQVVQLVLAYTIERYTVAVIGVSVTMD